MPKSGIGGVFQPWLWLFSCLAIVMLGPPSLTQARAGAVSSLHLTRKDGPPQQVHIRGLAQAAAAAAPTAAAPSAAPAPAQPDVTVVTTPEELQAAAQASATHIEIRAHLDCRNLTRLGNPDLPPTSSTGTRPRLALLYARTSMQSIRGNCSDPDAAAALGVSAGEPGAAGSLLPLKPRQCLILLPDAFLMANGGTFWLDNVYLRLERTLAMPDIAVISAGGPSAERLYAEIPKSDLYLTNVTFQGEFRGSAQGVALNVEASSALVQDCIFTDWAGDRSPVTVIYESAASIVNSVFRNMDLTSEIADVSNDGLVRFANTLLSNVTLHAGAIVSTTTNDYNEVPDFFVFYYAEDDAAYDVDWEPVAVGERGMFGAEFVVEDDLLGDCVYLGAEPEDLRPGCPPESLQQRAAMLLRAQEAGSQEQSGYGEGAAAGPEVEDLPTLADPWLAERLAELRLLPPPPPAWPPFAVAPRENPANRTELTPVPVPVPAGLLVPPLEETPAAVSAASAAVAAAAAGGSGSALDGRVLVVAVLAVLATIAVSAVAWALLALRALQRRPRHRDRPGGMLEARQRRRMRDWMWDGGTTDTHATGVTPVVSDRESLPRSTRTPPPVREPKALPQSAMNPAFEYALPTEVARLMGAPILETEEEQLLENLKAVPPTSAVSPSGGGGKSGPPGSARGRGVPSRDLRLHTASPSLEAGGSPSLRGMVLTGGSAGSGGGRGSMHGSNTEPLAGAADAREDSLHAETDEPGSTIVVAPYDLTLTSRGATHSSRGATQSSRGVTQSSNGTVDGTISSATSASEATGTMSAGVNHVRRMHDSEGSAVKAAPAVGAGQTDVRGDDPRIRRLHRLLDGFGEHDLLLGRFELLGREDRRRGGQAVVQFAEGKDRCEYAIKFFLDWDAFITEAALYAAAFPYIRGELSPDVLVRADAETSACGGGDAVPMAEVAGRFLPQVEAVCDGAAGGLEDPRGRPLPPCIVMEKGESLHDWSDRAEPDLFTALAVLSNISKRLADMHDAGYVHRDLKPANVMWLPRANRWTVIDFGCVARIGEHAPLSFTLAYAAPEVARAFCEQRRSMASAPALDAWSLGVMAYELLTGGTAFNLLIDGRVGVMRRLLGELPLPWEGELSPAVQRHLGMFKGPVLQLLERDPARRATMHRFHTACTKLFAARTTVEA